MRLVGSSDVQPAVKNRITDEYSQDPSAFAKRLLEDTSAANAGRIAASPVSPSRKFMRGFRRIMRWIGLFSLTLATLGALDGLISGHFTAGTIIFSAVLILAWTLILLGRPSGPLSRSSMFRLNDYQDAEAKYRDSVRTQLAEHLILLANTLHAESLASEEKARRTAAEQSAEVVLSTTDAPRLVELDNQEPVRVKALQDLQVFIDRMSQPQSVSAGRVASVKQRLCV